MAALDANILAVVEKTVDTVLAKKLSVSDQADLVYEALEKAKAEKLKIVETELQEARDYFASYMKELDAKNEQIMEENNSLKSQLSSLNTN